MWPLLYWGKFLLWASLVVQTVKNPLALWETWVWSLGWEEPLEEGMATHSSNSCLENSMGRGAWWGYGPCGCKESVIPFFFNFENLNHEWMLKFVKYFFWVRWKACVFFFSCFVNVVYHIDWLTFVEPSLYNGSKSHLILVYATFSKVLDPICWYMVEDFYICVHPVY